MDQIFVKDFVHETEIGVYKSEFGKKQRLRFNVFLTIDYDKKNKTGKFEFTATTLKPFGKIQIRFVQSGVCIFRDTTTRKKDTCLLGMERAVVLGRIWPWLRA